MTQKQQFLTPEGEAKLRAELVELTGPKREEIAKRLRSAIQMGDLSENADLSLPYLSCVILIDRTDITAIYIYF